MEFWRIIIYNISTSKPNIEPRYQHFSSDFPPSCWVVRKSISSVSSSKRGKSRGDYLMTEAHLKEE